MKKTILILSVLMVLFFMISGFFFFNSGVFDFDTGQVTKESIRPVVESLEKFEFIHMEIDWGYEDCVDCS